MKKIKSTGSLSQVIRNPLFLACCTLLAPATQAQMLEEIVVTAQKREQNLQDVPIAVSAFTGEMLVQAGVKDVFDLQTSVPSLTVNTSQSASATAFGIRGVFTSSSNFGLESSVGLYVDGVYRARQSSMINNMVDVASVEVLRGPQGTLFGRNTPSGAVLMYSKKPDHEGTGFIDASYGAYNLKTVSGAKSFSAIDDELAFRVTGFQSRRDGYLDHVKFGGEVDEDKINDRNRWGVRLQALWEPNDNVSVHIIADHAEIDELCCGASTWKNNLVADGVAAKVGSDATIQAMGGTVLNDKDFYNYQVAASFAPKSKNEDKGISMQVDWQTDSILFTSVTGYREFNSTDLTDADFSNLDLVTTMEDAQQSQFSQEFRISNEYDNFNYVVGLFYYHQKLDLNSTVEAGDDLAAFAAAELNPVFAIPGSFPTGTGSLNVSNQKHYSYAVFGQVDYQLTDTLLLTAGLRWTKEEKELLNTFTEDASSCDPLVCGQFNPGWGFWFFDPLIPKNNLDVKLNDDKITGTLKLSWFMNDETMFYASFGTGYKAGGTNTDRVGQGIDVLFGAEDAESFELGMKLDLPNQALRINAALHLTNTDDLQTSSYQGVGFVLSNAGVAETYGAEVDVNWQATDSLNLTLAYAFNHAKYEDFENGSCWVGTPWHTGVTDPATNSNGLSCNRSGDDIADNAENVLVLTANQTFDLSGDINAFIYGEIVYTDERMTDIDNDPLKGDNAYTLVNLRAGLHFAQWDADLSFWGRNIFDDNYITQASNTTLQAGNLIAFPVEPRTWGVTVKKNF